MQYNSRYQDRGRSGGSPRKRRRRRMRPRFFVFVALLIAVVMLLIWGVSALVGVLTKDKVETLRYGMLEDTTSVQAILVREENIEYLDGYSRIQYIATEDKNVRTGDPIITYYQPTMSSADISALDAVRQEIQQYQQSNQLGVTRSEEMIYAEDRIAEYVKQIKQFVYGGENLRLDELEVGLRVMMGNRQDLVKQNQNALEDQYLQNLYNDENAILTRISQMIVQVFATDDGRVSYLFDGYETALSAGALPTLEVEGVSTLITSSKPPVQSEDLDRGRTPVFRIVTPDKWHAVLLTPEKKWQFGVNATCEVRFAGFENIVFHAKVTQLKSDGDNTMVVLLIEEDIGPLINQRQVIALIGGRSEGLMVSRKAVKEVNGQPGVYLDTGAFVPVEIRGNDKKSVLVWPVQEGALGFGSRVTTR